ncbi:MAG TPA: hypothetical protein PLQ80_06500 [Candidatus Syntrophosphaera sp.]|nr:hypothetical protein [Candidatus Syntrophosphaera sp.]
MIIDLRESSLADIRFMITKKQLKDMVKDRMYDLFGLNHGMGRKRYSDEQYHKALISTITYEADSFMDVFDDFAKGDEATEDIIASFIRNKVCAYFANDIEIPLRNNLLDMFVFYLYKTAETLLITNVMSKSPTPDTNEYDLFGRHRDNR